jgi:hypothetical protein
MIIFVKHRRDGSVSLEILPGQKGGSSHRLPSAALPAPISVDTPGVFIMTHANK